MKTGLRAFGIVQAGLFVTGAALTASGARPLALDGVEFTPAPEEDARRIAQEFLGRVDWSQPTILVWMPGINAPAGVRREFRDALDGITAPYWIGALEYPRHADMGRNVPIGARALELVLEEIRRRDPDGSRYRVSIGGESLGAWMTAEAMQRPIGSVIDRAVFFGASAPAPRVPTELAGRVRELHNTWDPAAMPFIGSGELWTDGGDLAFGGGSSRIPGAILHMLVNPFATIAAVGTTIGMHVRPDGYRQHPHNYQDQMPESARYLIEP